MSEGTAEDAKVDDGVRTNSAKTGEAERAARELQEEMHRNVEEAQERVLESEENLCRELEENMYSWERKVEYHSTSARRSGPQ